MPRNVTLGKLVYEVRAEIGATPNVGQGVGSMPMIEQVIRRTQDKLYHEYNWPHLLIERDEPLMIQQRYYTFNDDVNFERILGCWVKYADNWRPVEYGFDPMTYNTSDPERSEYDDPIRRWRHYEGNQYEVWPVPTANNQQTLRFKALRYLNPLLANTDKCDLDSTLIVLFASAEILARLKAADAESKMNVANQYYKNLRANFDKSGSFIMGGGISSPQIHRSSPIYGGRV